MPTATTVSVTPDTGQSDAPAFTPRFAPAWAVPYAAATISDAAWPDYSARRGARGAAPEGPTWFCSVSPGSVQLGRVDLARAQRRLERELTNRSADVALRVAVDGLVDDVEALFTRRTVRARITSWSSKSIANMIRRLSTLDYSEFLGEGTPAMVTLTLPDCWELVAPTGRAFKALVRSFAERYRRAWGKRLRGIWKLEFQRRGAPHLHMLTVPPTGLSGGKTWRQWFADTWTSLVIGKYVEVGAPLDTELLRAGMLAVHEHHKSSADYAEGLRASDPKRIAVYFSKHGTLADKWYQHIVPAAWRGEGDGPGRFWGYWGLERADDAVEVTHDQAVVMARTLRRWTRANGGVRVASVWRTDTSNGVMTQRKVRRRVGRMRGTAGFLVVNDGPAVAMMLAGVIRRT